MKFISHALRIHHIIYVYCKYKIKYKEPIEKRIRNALEELGPLFIKFGQLLSTRVDILSKEMIQELSYLQDKVSPFDGQLAKARIEFELKSRLEEHFKDFELTPLASASIAQVHAATLLNGNPVVIKVLRPHIHKQIHRDIALLKTLTKCLPFFSKIFKQVKAHEIVLELEKVLLDELDLTREAAHASQLKRNFKNNPLLYVPQIQWSLTTKNILVMERISGISVNQIEQLKALGFNLKQLAERGVEIFFTQVFRDSFFHADMHPGNLFVCTKDIQNPRFIAVDFGIMGTLSPEDQRYIAENFLAFFNRDYRRVAKLHAESNWISSNVRIDEFENAIRMVCEPIFERPLSEISFGNLLLQLFQLARRYKINIQPQLILLQKTLFTIEGLGRQLYPELNLWSSAKPFLENWTKKQIGISAFIQKMQTHAPYWLDKLPELPSLLYTLMEQRSQSNHLAPKTVLEIKTSKKDICIGILLGIILSLTGFLISTVIRK